VPPTLLARVDEVIE